MATAKKKQPGTAVTIWEQKMAEAAKKQSSAAKPVGLFKSLSTRGGVLSVDDTPIKDNELRVVILVSAHENQMYDGPFRADTPQTPICYAFSEPDSSEDGMKPHDKAGSPQCATCEDCEHNVMGSSDVGKGKACKNVMRLALVTEDAAESATAMEEAEVRMLKVPVTSVKHWSKYIHKLDEEMSRPSWGVVTKVFIVPDPKSQFKVCFEFEELLTFDQELYDQVQKRIVEVSRDIVGPYPDIEEQPAPTKKKPALKKPPVKARR